MEGALFISFSSTKESFEVCSSVTNKIAQGDEEREKPEKERQF